MILVLGDKAISDAHKPWPFEVAERLGEDVRCHLYPTAMDCWLRSWEWWGLPRSRLHVLHFGYQPDHSPEWFGRVVSDIVGILHRPCVVPVYVILPGAVESSRARRWCARASGVLEASSEPAGFTLTTVEELFPRS